jgi:signal transduction histidine kinase
VEKRYVAKSGAIVPVNLTATVVRDQRGRVLYGLHIVEDIAERKRAEQSLQTYAQDLAKANRELRAASELKDHFLAVTNHELRTPLTSILGFASMLGEGWDRLPDEDRREFVWRIHGQSERLARLIDDLLTLSSAQAGALEMASTEVPVDAAIHDAIHAMGPGRQGVRVRCRPGLRVTGDPEGLFRILSNFLSNAFTHGAPPVTVDVRERGKWVEIRVSDQGPGVPADFVGRLFEKFAQADRTASRSHGGTGLGLAIVRELAHAQGGEAWYEQGPMGGSTFCITLPRAATDAAGGVTLPSFSRNAS